MVGSVAPASVRTHVASCSMPTGAAACRQASRSRRESPATHMNAPRSAFAMFGPVLGVGDATFRDGLGEGTAGANRPGGGDGRLERGPAGGGEAGGASGVEHGDVTVLGARRDGGVVQVAFDRDGDDRALPGCDGRGGERCLAGPGRTDQGDRSTVALPLCSPTRRAGVVRGPRWRATARSAPCGRAAFAPPVAACCRRSEG